MFHRIITALTLTSILVGCGSSTNPNAPSTITPGDTPPVSAAQVNATPALAFTPATIALTAGGTVTFVFGSIGHNVWFDNDPTGAPATIGGVNANTSVQRVFAVAGVYNYYCHIHPGMHGTITVTSVAASTNDESPASGSSKRVP